MSSSSVKRTLKMPVQHLPHRHFFLSRYGQLSQLKPMTTTPRIKRSCFSFQNGVQILIYNVHRLEERLSLCFIGVFQQTRTKFLL